MESYKTNNCELRYSKSGTKDQPVILWGHGWGQSHEGFAGLIQSLENNAAHYSFDFPGFGQSPAPETPLGTEDYADMIAAFIKDHNLPPITWIGHSFGGRVGLQLAAHHPDLIKSMVLIAAAGLPRKRPLLKKLYLQARIRAFKFCKLFIPLGLDEEWLRQKFGSADYKQAGVMRDIFVKVVNEDLSAQAAQAQCPTLLIYGENDTETPPEIGERLHNLIKNAEIIRLPGQDHYTVLGQGRHQVTPLIKKFIKDTKL